MQDSQPRYLSSQDVAQFCGVNISIIDSWVKCGRLESDFDGAMRKISPSELMHFMHLNHLAIPVELLSEVKHSSKNNTPKALVIDGDKVVAATISKVLEELNLEVMQVNNGFDASITYIKRKPQLLTLDLSLSDMSSIELIENIKSTQQDNTKILVIANSIPSTMEKAKKAGADAILPKPFDNDTLKRTVKILLQL